MSHTPTDSHAAQPADSDRPGDDDEYRQTMAQLSRLPAPPSFRDQLEETIRRRSGGRFFGRKAFGDRVPYELVLAVLILAVGLVAYLVLRSSSTGSLRYETHPDTSIVAPGAQDVVPQPPPVD